MTHGVGTVGDEPGHRHPVGAERHVGAQRDALGHVGDADQVGAGDLDELVRGHHPPVDRPVLEGDLDLAGAVFEDEVNWSRTSFVCSSGGSTMPARSAGVLPS